jgi:predicted HAD superfamily Cof-like phosphohydrolase
MNGQSAADMVREFHETFSLPMSETPRQPGPNLAGIRTRIYQSEVRELGDAVLYGELPDIALELADCVYVLYGTALTYGIGLDEVIEAVHAANMTKSRGDTVDGKVQKGPNYRKPDVAGILARQAEQPTDGVRYRTYHRLTVSHHVNEQGQLAPLYELAHTPECDRLPYGVKCALDVSGKDRMENGWPDEIGEYTIAAWDSKYWTDSGWEYDAGVDWDVFIPVSPPAPAAA